MLTKEHTIDIDLVNEMIRLARPMKVTFHKAIDSTKNIVVDFKKLLKTDIDHVLTSGGAETALEGRNIINEMVEISNGKVKVIAAGKIINSNLREHQRVLTCPEFHGKKIVGNLSDSGI